MMYSLFLLVVYSICAIFEDRYGMLPMIGTLSAFVLVMKPLKNQNNKNTKMLNRPRDRFNKVISSSVVVFFLLEFFFSYYLRIYQREVFDYFQIETGGVMLINSFVVLIELAFAIIYFTVFRNECIFRIDTRMLSFLLLMLFPFVLKDLFNAAYSINEPGLFENTNYLNLAYRALILASLTEELLYRGVLFSELCLYFKPATSAIIQAVIFTLVHSERWLQLFSTGDIAIAINLIAVFAMGVLTAYFRYQTNSLIPGILMHFALNGGVYDIIMFMLL